MKHVELQCCNIGANNKIGHYRKGNKITALITAEMHAICSTDNICMHGRAY